MDVGIEDLEIIQLLPHPFKFQGLARHFSNGNCRATARIAIQHRQDGAGDRHAA